MLNPAQKLQQKLNEIVYPELSDRLIFGCELIDPQVKGDLSFKIGIDAEHVEGKIRIAGYDFEYRDFHILGSPISLDLIMAALEKKGFSDSEYFDGHISLDYYRCSVPYTPLQPLTPEAVKMLIEIFEFDK